MEINLIWNDEGYVGKRMLRMEQSGETRGRPERRLMDVVRKDMLMVDPVEEYRDWGDGD